MPADTTAFSTCLYFLQYWNFRTIYGDWEPSRHRVVVLGRLLKGSLTGRYNNPYARVGS